jgi:Flp pilus assembly protein TadB
MTSLQLAIGAGLLVGLGLAMLVLALAPAPPDLAGALERLAPSHDEYAASARVSSVDEPLQDRVGLYLIRHTPVARWWSTPTKDLAMLQIPAYRFYGEKALYALLGFVVAPVLSLVLAYAHIRLGVLIPVGGSIVLAGVLFLLPNYNARDNAKTAREEFLFALAAYIDGVAMLRDRGAGIAEAMTDAIDPGADSWVFRRLGEQLQLSSLNDGKPWDAFDQLATQLDLPALTDLADKTRFNAKTGAPITEPLRDLATSLRDARLSSDQAAAGNAGERMSLPTACMAILFLLMLMVPALLRIVYSS